jgi:hypothetical protein
MNEGTQPGAGVAKPEDEALQDALDELTRMDNAEEFDVKDVDPLALSMIPSVVDHTARRKPADPIDDGAILPEGGFRTLEDLYAEFRDIGGGNRFIRVHRRAPATWNGIRIAGFLADLHEQPSMTEFASRFGGGQYEVSVMGTVANTTDEMGTQRVRSLRSVRIDVPGRPVALQPQTPQMGMGSGRRSTMDGDQANAQVEIAKINAQARNQERSEAERKALMDALVKAKQTPTEIFGQLDALAEKRANDVRVGLNESLASMKRESERLRTQLDERERAIASMRIERDEAVNKLRLELIETRQIAQREATDREERRVKEVKERFDDEMRRVRDDQAKTVQQLAQEHAAAMSQAADLNARERDRLRDDAQRREAQIAADSKQREEFSERSHRDRVEAMEKAFLREIDSLKLSMMQQIESIRSSESSKSSLAERSAQIQVDALKSELARKDMELAALRRENETLRKQAIKTPVEAIQEAHLLASMTGMIPASDVPMGGEKEEDENFDWKKGLIQLAKGAVEKIPETLQRMEAARVQNQNVAAQQQAYAQHQQAAFAQQQQARQRQIAQQSSTRPLPPGYQQQMPMQPAPMNAPRRAPPGYVEAPSGSTLPSAPGEATYIPPVGYGQPVQAVQTPTMRVVETAEVTPNERAQQARAQVAGDSTQPPAQPEQRQTQRTEPDTSTGTAGVEITREQVQEIVDNLEAAVSMGVVTPESFAEKFVERVGKTTAFAIVENLTPQQLVEQIAAGKESGSTPLATMRGRQFLGKLWTEAKRLATQ